MSNQKEFKIEVENIPTTEKNDQPLDAVEEVAEKKGYVSRARRKLVAPQVRQIHAWVTKRVREELIAESSRRRVQQGVILEEALELYKKQKQINRFI